jgi:hypothetical protein
LKRLSASVSRYPVRLDRGHFSSIGGSCHEEEESLVPSDVVDFSIVARQRVHYRAAPATNWSDPATWPNRKVPVAGDKVIIEKDKQVVLDVTPPA